MRHWSTPTGGAARAEGAFECQARSQGGRRGGGGRAQAPSVGPEPGSGAVRSRRDATSSARAVRSRPACRLPQRGFLGKGHGVAAREIGHRYHYPSRGAPRKLPCQKARFECRLIQPATRHPARAPPAHRFATCETTSNTRSIVAHSSKRPEHVAAPRVADHRSPAGLRGCVEDLPCSFSRAVGGAPLARVLYHLGRPAR
jgi:hypothetical protein